MPRTAGRPGQTGGDAREGPQGLTVMAASKIFQPLLDEAIASGYDQGSDQDSALARSDRYGPWELS